MKVRHQRCVRECNGMRVVHTTVCIVASVLCIGAEASLLPGMELPASLQARPDTILENSSDGSIVVKCTGGGYQWPGVAIRPPAGYGDTFDWSDVGEVRVVVSNRSSQAENIWAAVFGRGAGFDTAPTRSSRVPAQAVRTIVVPIADDAYLTDEPVALKGMAGKIRATKDRIDYGRSRVDVWTWRNDSRPGEFAVLRVETAHPARIPQVIPASGFFPFVDRYGQFKHGDWPGKIHSDEDFAAQRRDEEAWLAANPGSPTPDVNEFGGWTGGPQLEATGFFRTEKVNGKWWLVDPKGRLFFSLGIDSIFPGYATRVKGRERYFGGAYPNESMLFAYCNLHRKYGADWKSYFNDMVHRRFKAWGINTLGNWCWDTSIWSARRTPYCLCIDYSSKTGIPGWKPCNGRRVPDVHSEKFVADLAEQVRRFAVGMKDDPWCLGVFVDNELGFQGCGTNAAEVAEKYYSTVRAVLKKEFPNHLYLGSRLHISQPSSAWRAAARHCDVVSHNFYEMEPSYDLPPGSEDKPMLMGEFHFGAKDRGHFIGGCVTVYDQKERGECFKHYVRACLDNPRLVGCHWFEYFDQPFVGRGGDSDCSENYNDGFVSVCDVPYPEMVEASREIAAQMYTRRYGKPLDK